MTITEKDIAAEWWALLIACKDPEATKAKILGLFSSEPDGEHEWSQQDIYEQLRKIIRKYE